jgi:hypothetical protein
MNNPFRFWLCFVLMGTLSGCATSARSTYNAGYDRGRSDAVKQQYWMVQNQQRATTTKASVLTSSYLPITVTGPNTVPHTEYVRIEEAP